MSKFKFILFQPAQATCGVKARTLHDTLSAEV